MPITTEKGLAEQLNEAENQVYYIEVKLDKGKSVSGEEAAAVRDAYKEIVSAPGASNHSDEIQESVTYAAGVLKKAGYDFNVQCEQLGL